MAAEADSAKGAGAVDEYLAAVPAAARAALQHLRQTVRSIVPEASETISYQMPAFRFQGRMLLWYAAFKHHCSLFPATDKMLKDYGEELRPYLAGKGTLRFTTEEPIPEALLRKIVRTRMAEIDAARGGYRRSGRG